MLHYLEFYLSLVRSKPQAIDREPSRTRTHVFLLITHESAVCVRFIQLNVLG